MIRKAYIIILDHNSFDNAELSAFHKTLTTASGIVSWWHYLDNVYIIITNSNVTRKSLADYLYQIIPNKKFFTCELKLKEYHGFLQKDAWAWIDKWKALVN